MAPRIINRAVVFDKQNKRVLLVKNRNAGFWYAPGGEWNAQEEVLDAGAVREVLEETGVQVRIIRLLYLRTFQPAKHAIQLEIFWLARPQTLRIPHGHKDRHGLVETACWFSRSELRKLAVFPERLKTQFWADIRNDRRNLYINE